MRLPAHDHLRVLFYAILDERLDDSEQGVPFDVVSTTDVVNEAFASTDHLTRELCDELWSVTLEVRFINTRRLEKYSFYQLRCARYPLGRRSLIGISKFRAFGENFITLLLPLLVHLDDGRKALRLVCFVFAALTNEEQCIQNGNVTNVFDQRIANRRLILTGCYDYAFDLSGNGGDIISLALLL